ncbi:MAG: hypothetical protein SFY68_14610 [Candidatus Sumerlaeia bacterium]|nr:hypothetical protein [Candidatus Sumerlaeia bacterium]
MTTPLLVRLVFSDRSVDLSETDLEALPAWEESITMNWSSGVNLTDSASALIRVSAQSQHYDGLKIYLARTTCEEIGVQILRGTETLLRGRLISWREEGLSLLLKMKRSALWENKRNACRDLSLLPEGTHLHNPAWIPLIFGDSDLLEAIPLSSTIRVRSLHAITEETSEILLDQNVGFPAQGRIQIRDEVIEYSSYSPVPPKLSGLTRPAPRSHPNRPNVYLLPPTPSWLVADHEAGIIEVRPSSDEESVPLTGYTVSHPLISSRETTAIHFPQYPLRIDHEDFQVEHIPPYEEQNWTTKNGTTVQSPWNAFFAPDGAAGGTSFTTGNRRLVAELSRNLAKGRERFSRIAKAELVFRVRTNYAWGNESQFEITARTATRTLFAVYQRDAFVLAPVVEAAPVPPQQVVTTGGIRRWQPIQLGSIMSANPALWPDLNPLLHDTDSITISSTFSQESVTEAILTARVTHIPGDGNTPIRFIRFTVEMSASQRTQVRMRIDLPNHESVDETLEVTPYRQVYYVQLQTSTAEVINLLESGTQFQLIPEDGGTLTLYHVRVDVQEDLPLPALTTQPLSPTVAFQQVQAFQPDLRLDITPLLENGNWDLFNGDGDLLEVIFELKNPEPTFWLNLQNVHVALQIHPARRVEPTTRLWVKARGFHTNPGDGLCNPIDVLRTLMQDERFLGLPESFAEAIWDSRRLEVERLQLRYARTIDSPQTLGMLLHDAFAEILHVPVYRNNAWLVESLAVPEDERSAFPLSLDQLVLPYPNVQHQAAEFCPGEFLLQSRNQRFILPSRDTELHPRSRWNLEWLRRGLPWLAEQVALHYAKPLRTLEYDLHPQEESVPLLGLHQTPSALLYAQENTLRPHTRSSSKGTLSARGQLFPKAEILWEQLGSPFRLMFRRDWQRLVILYNDLALLRAEPHCALLSGQVETPLLQGTPPQHGISWDATTNTFRICHGDTGTWIAFTAEGNLRTSHPVSITSTGTLSSSSEYLVHTAEKMSLHIPGGPPICTLQAGAVVFHVPLISTQ